MQSISHSHTHKIYFISHISLHIKDPKIVNFKERLNKTLRVWQTYLQICCHFCKYLVFPFANFVYLTILLAKKSKLYWVFQKFKKFIHIDPKFSIFHTYRYISIGATHLVNGKKPYNFCLGISIIYIYIYVIHYIQCL